MALSVVKDSIDLGIITKDPEKMLVFYRDTLGLELVGELPMPGGGTMYRLNCGTSVIKIVVQGREPRAVAPPGGLAGATGYRYWTITVDNIEEAVKTCEDAGYKISVPITEFRPGVTISMIEDPDGNWVELVQMAG
ncbi:MAG: VOC family protein [Deltaproteobacteria bacterium]|nr:VOC family protein [Deltaproteobacteria bacterium]MBT4268613.1 VOC family protein [Deltaproteobacteria bacterium]MBT4642716.1 VOC family protein [Deltaproteobacteria bacterium]MBT6501980.1 VOC family protein [Deltaproteobacteria bacterium]MBT6611783.1 VOC family protein [Deltaproteobacteria bacterium]